MAFTRPPLEYPLVRLSLGVSLARSSWLRDLPLIPKEDREECERLLGKALGLDSAVAAGILKRYRLQWTSRGRLRKILLVPTERHRRAPGLRRVKELFPP